MSKGFSRHEMDIPVDGIPLPYSEAFRNKLAPFIFFHEKPGGDGPGPRCFTRGDFLQMSFRAAGVIARMGLKPGDRFLNGFGRNSPVDLAFRLGAAITGVTPVTLNWQADNQERAAFKANLSSSRLMLIDHLIPEALISAVRGHNPAIMTYDTGKIENEPIPEVLPEIEEPGELKEKIIIFTSGTTGDPKGVVLSWGNFETNASALRQMFHKIRKDPMSLFLVNPFHHTNSTALSDWFLREPGAVIHMFPRYTTPYWSILAEVAEKAEGLVIAPCVSRHFDFLEELASRGGLPVSEEKLRKGLSRVSFLMGSSPVGPATVERVIRWTGHPPLVRFGSTETCLQVVGTPAGMDEVNVMKAFRAGWERDPSPGFYIGRPHLPYTDAMVVKSITHGEKGFMEPCGPGEEGYIVASGKNIMKGYLRNPVATSEVLHDGWYLGFGDIGFRLVNPEDGEDDLYWLGRDSSLVIKGGANYSSDQISAELAAFLRERYCLEEGSFDIAVVGLRIESEHDDSCCVMMDVSRISNTLREEIAATFITEAAKVVTKGSRPDHLLFGDIPRNFKGGVSIRELKRKWTEGMKSGK